MPPCTASTIESPKRMRFAFICTSLDLALVRALWPLFSIKRNFFFCRCSERRARFPMVSLSFDFIFEGIFTPFRLLLVAFFALPRSFFLHFPRKHTQNVSSLRLNKPSVCCVRFGLSSFIAFGARQRGMRTEGVQKRQRAKNLRTFLDRDGRKKCAYEGRIKRKPKAAQKRNISN